MPAAEPALDEATERIALGLLRHLEWQAECFSLVFLFADVGPALQTADLLDQQLGAQQRSLQRDEVNDEFARDPEAAVDRFLEHLPAISSKPGAVWLGMHRHPGDEQWNTARRVFLARLNERRYLLEQGLARPLVLVFPAGFRSEARYMAPDLWHVRALSHELHVVGRVMAYLGTNAQEEWEKVSDASSNANLPAYNEWRRTFYGAAEAARIFLPTAWAAVDELLKAGRPGDAERTAGEALNLARQRASVDASAALQRDLSIALDQVGRVARAQGDLRRAELVCRESLELRRLLVGRLGGTPEALRELSISLQNVGKVAEAQGDLVGVEGAYLESLKLRRLLVDRLHGNPESLRDLSIALDSVGQLERARGDWAQAERVFRESLDLHRQLAERVGQTPQAVRDLSIALDSLGRIAQEQGDLAMMGRLYGESLTLRRKLVERVGKVPLALRDLSISVGNVGRVAELQRDWTGAEGLYRESLELRRQLVEAMGGTPEALRDLSTSLNNVGRVLNALGERVQAEKLYRESLELSRQLVKRLGGTPQALDDLGIAIVQLADLPPGDPALHAEALAIYESLAARFPQIQTYTDRMQALRGDNSPSPFPESESLS